MFWQRRPLFVILSNVLILSSLRLSSCVEILASCKASWYADRGYIILKARIWTRSISLDRQVDRALCQITQQYSRTEGTRATWIATRSTAMTPPLRLRTQIMCRRLDALDTITQMCSFHLRLSSITEPRTWCERTVLSTWPSIRKGVGGVAEMSL